MTQEINLITETELLQKASTLAGKSLASLNVNYKTSNKGKVGQLIETYLGADAGNKALPDFTHLGIELKTIPITSSLKVKESTFICRVEAPVANFKASRVFHKLHKVLWVPIIDNKRIATPFLWHLHGEYEAIIANDWQELNEALIVGATINAYQGQYLQLRPKAANAKVKIPRLNNDNVLTAITPQGFYLRATCTEKILRDMYAYSN